MSIQSVNVNIWLVVFSMYFAKQGTNLRASNFLKNYPPLIATGLAKCFAQRRRSTNIVYLIGVIM